MAPILIDNRCMMKLLLISVLSTAIIFAVGFFSGYQQATTFYTADRKTETLVLPVSASFLDSDIEPQLPATIAAGAEIDVDLPQAGSKTGTINSDVKSKLPVSSNEEKNISHGFQNKLGFQNNLDESAVFNEPDFVVFTLLTPSELNSIKYSIQVGAFGRLINAENMVRTLRSQYLNAYVSDYLDKKNKDRYNVRFGYFFDKKSAVVALNKYKNKNNGEGYLVNFSVKNITKLADAKNVKGVAITEKTKKMVSPEIMPSDAMLLETGQNIVLQADFISPG